jgi:hypothetical protein
MYQEINDSEAISPKKNTLSIMNEVKPRVMKFFILWSQPQNQSMQNEIKNSIPDWSSTIKHQVVSR